MKHAGAQITLILGVLAAAQVCAQSDSAGSPIGFGDYWNADLAFTYTFWDSLGDLEPAGRGGPFDTEAAGFDVSLEGSVGRLGNAIVFVGFNFGMAGFNSNIFLEEDFGTESNIDLTYAVGTLNFRLGNPGNQYVDIDVGLGAYNAGNMYIDCIAVPACLASEISVTEPGGYIGASWAVWRGLKLAGRIHYVDFGTIGSIGPESGTLEGPMYTAQIGWEFGNWFR